MRRTFSVLTNSLLFGALSIGCAAEGEALTESECEELVEHVAGVLPSTNKDDAYDKCVAGKTWNRVGYECAMNAYFRAALSSCLMKQR